MKDAHEVTWLNKTAAGMGGTGWGGVSPRGDNQP